MLFHTLLFLFIVTQTECVEEPDFAERLFTPQTPVNISTKIGTGISFLMTHEVVLSGDSWEIVLEYNLQEYTEVLQRLHEELNQLHIAVMDLKFALPSMHFRKNLSFNATNGVPDIHTQLKRVLFEEITSLTRSTYEVEDVLSDVERTIIPITRRKRFVGFLAGSAISLLFGMYATSSLRSLSQQVEQQDLTNKYYAHVLGMQATVVNATSYLATNNAKQIRKIGLATEAINKELVSFKDELASDIEFLARRLTSLMTISAAFRQLESVLAAIRFRTSQFLEAWGMLADQKLSSFFLPSRALLEILSKILVKLPPGLSFIHPMDSGHLYRFYHSATVVSGITPDGKLRLFCSLPLKGASRSYTLFAATPLPTRLPNSSLAAYYQPDKQYLAVSSDNFHFASLTEDDLAKNCRGKPVVLCEPAFPIKSPPEKDCLMALFTGDNQAVKNLCEKRIVPLTKSYFYNIRGTQYWLYSVPKVTRVTFACLSNTTHEPAMEAIHIDNSGLLRVPDSCTAHIEGISLMSKTKITSTYIFHSNTIMIPNIKAIANSLKQTHNVTHFGEWENEAAKILKELPENPFSPSQAPGLPETYFASLQAQENLLTEKIKLHSNIDGWVYWAITTLFIIVIGVGCLQCNMWTFCKGVRPKKATPTAVYRTERNNPNVSLVYDQVRHENTEN